MQFEHAYDGRSTRVTQHSNTDVKADEQIKPLRDHIIVEPLNVVLSKFIIVKEDVKPLRGIVKAVGPGHFPLEYDHDDKSKRTKCWDSDVFEETTLKVGDVVELGGYDYRGYSFPTIYWGGKLHMICREADVSGIIPNVTEEQARQDQEAFTV